MPVSYPGNSTGIVDHASVTVTNPVDADGLSAASNNSATQTLANEVQHLKEKALLRTGDSITGALTFGASGSITAAASSKIIGTAANAIKATQDDGIGYSDSIARTRLKMIQASEFMPNSHNDGVSTAILGFSTSDGLYTHDFGSTLTRYANFTLPRTSSLSGMRILGKNTSGASRTLTFESKYYNRVDTLIGGTPPATPTASGDIAASQVLTWTAGQYDWKNITLATGVDFWEGIFAHVSLVFGAGAGSAASALLIFAVEIQYTLTDLTGKDV